MFALTLKDESRDPASALGLAVQLADASAPRNEEGIGFGILERARSLAPLTAAAHRDALDHLRGLLLQGMGVNALNSGDRSQAAEWFVLSLADAISVRDLQLTRHLMDQVSATIGAAKPEHLRLLNGVIAQAVLPDL